MRTMDFALVPPSGHSLQERVEFHASEIFRLWNGGSVSQLLLAADSDRQRHERYRIAAMLPTQELTAEDYEALEDVGVLVLEVPSDLADASEAEIANYLTTQLNEGFKATAARMAALGTTTPSATESGENELRFSEEEEAELLELVNHPANQLGGHF